MSVHRSNRPLTTDQRQRLAAFAKGAFAAEFQRLVELIEQRYNVKVDPALVDKHLAPVCKAIDDWTRPKN